MTILKISRFAYYAAIVCLVVTASLLTAVRLWLLPHAPEWRDELQSTISAMIGETIQIKSLSAGMRGFRPELTVRGFRIENTSNDGPPLEFERLGVGVELIRSLVSGHPVVNRISLIGAKLRLSLRPDGSLGVMGLKPGDPPMWLFAEGEVRLSDIDLEWSGGKEGQIIALGRAQIRLRNAGERHTLDARVDLPGKLGKSLKMSAEIVGNPVRSNDWRGNLYLDAKRLREGAFVESLPVRMRSGELGMQAWAEWKGGALREVAGKLDMDRPVLTWHKPDGADGMMNLDNLSGWLFWKKQDNGWRLDAKRLSLSQKGKTWPETDFAVAIGNASDNSLQSLRVAINYLRLDDVQSLLAGGLPLLDGNIGDTMRAFAAKGEVQNGSMVYQTDGHFGFCGKLTGLEFNSPEGWPKFGRLTGNLCGNDRNGSADFEVAKLEFNLPRVWQKPIVLDVFGGSFQWRRTGGAGISLVQAPVDGDKLMADSAWSIVGNRIAMTAPGLQANGGFALDLPAGEGESPVIDLDAHLREVDAGRLRDYLPLNIMTPHAKQWLGQLFEGGKLKTADVLLRGRLDDFPFPHNEGLFEAKVDSENMELNFSPEWPHLYDIKAKVLFFSQSLFIDSEGGRIGNIPFHTVHAETGDYVGDGWMGLTSSLDGDMASGMKFLRQTPARFIPERLSKAADVSGPGHLDLNLLIPMTVGKGEVGVSGLLQLNNDTIALKEVNLKVQELTGLLSFTTDGMAGKQIIAKALDEPILFDVDQQNGDILFDITGRADATALNRIFPGDYWKHAAGGFAYHLNLQIPESLDSSSKPLRIALSSDLAGLELKLPEPLNKAAAEKRDFNANLALLRGDQMSVRLTYDHQGSARLSFSDNGGFHLENGDVFWGKPHPPASDEEMGLGLYLKLKALDIGEWRDLLAEFGDGLPRVVPRELDIEASRLVWNGEDLGSFYLAGKREGGELHGEVDCYYGKGIYNAAFPEYSHGLLRLDFESLMLPKFPDAKDAQAMPPDPSSLPALQMHANHLIRQGMDLGELDLLTERWTSGVNIKQMNLVSSNHELGLKGSWMRQDGRDETRLSGKLKVTDLDGFLNLLGYGKEVYMTPTEAAFSLGWAGAPQQFSSGSVVGEVRLNMGRGRVLQLEPGLGRALGVLNLQTLRRLLLLDFSDLFGKGLAYDSMEGVFQLGGGQARTKGFMVDAVAADILIMGRVGLVNHDFDQTVSVIPHTMASIPLAGAIVGGAAVGAVVDLAHRLVGADDVNLASTNYSVTGSWDDPQIKHIEGSMPLDMIDRAWSDFKSMSGMGGKGQNGSD